MRVRSSLCRTNLPSRTAFRAFGVPQANAVLETAITHVASYLDMAPEQVQQFRPTFYFPKSSEFLTEFFTSYSLMACCSQGKSSV
jgi:xanthine dehydrogenase molybdopterin-binding subunit B